VPSVPPWNLRPTFEAQTCETGTNGFEAQTTKLPASSVLHMHPLVTQHVSPPSSTGCPPSPLEPRSTHTSAVLTRSTRSLSCTPAFVIVPDVSHLSWSPGLLVPQSKLHFCPSPLPVNRHGTSLLDLHLAVDHRLRALHLHTASQETCCTTQLTSWLAHKLSLDCGSR
jgi:hypothetical protein